MNLTVTEKSIIPKNTIVDPNISALVTSCFCSLTLCVSLPAAVSNMINVYIFSSFKTVDSVTVCFLFLACIDMLAMSLFSVINFLLLFKTLGFTWSISFVAHTYLCSNVYGVLANMARATTTYIALQRGLCVAMPFLTRHLFNKTKSLIVLVTLSLVSVICWFPQASLFNLMEIPHPIIRNDTMLIIEFWDIWHTAYVVYQIFNKAVIGVTEYAIMFVCAIIIASGMRSSMRLKSSMSHADDKTSRSDNVDSMNSRRTVDKKSQDNAGVTKTMDKDSKEFRVIQQSFLVVLITIVCTGPVTLNSLYLYFSQRAERTKSNSSESDYQAFNLMMISIGYVLQATDSLCNFFIYLKYNSKFRNQLHLTFNCRPLGQDTTISAGHVS